MLYLFSLALFIHHATAVADDKPQAPAVFFQAHRGGMDEVPENTLPAFIHAWNIPGAVPEVDLRTTRDGVIVCIHDETPARTTNAPEPWNTTNIRDIPYEQLAQWDAGITFSEAFRGTPVPALRTLFDLMREDETRQIYLDIKEVEPDLLLALIREYGFEKRVIYVHGKPETCLELSRLHEGARTMTWLSGAPGRIRQRYAELRETGFAGISQLQFHLHVREEADTIEYWLDEAFIRQAAAELDAAGAVLQLRPFAFDARSLARMIGWGVYWYVTDAPEEFHRVTAEAMRIVEDK